MTPEQAIKNGFWMTSATPGSGPSDANIYRVAAGTYGWADATSPTTFNSADCGLRLGVGVVPGNWTHDAGSGITSTFRTQDAFPTSGGDGADLIVQVGSGDGAGRDGSFSVPGNGLNSEKFGYAAEAGGARATAVGNTATANADDSVIAGYQAGLLVTAAGTTVVGSQALQALTTNTQTTAIGFQAGQNCTAQENTYVGYQAGQNNANANERCVMIGALAGQAATAIYGTTAIGYRAGNAVSGAGTTCIGGYSGDGSTAGYNNTFVGWGSAYNVSGDENVAVGEGALECGGASAASRNVIIGCYNSVGPFSAITDSVYIGREAGINGGSSLSVLIGANVAGTLTNGGSNVVIGRLADVAATATADAVCVGANAQVAVNGVTIGESAALLVSGTDNTVVGASAAGTLTTGQNVVIIGHNADVSAAAVGDAVCVGADASVAQNGVTIGFGAAPNVTANDNVVVGYSAGSALTSGLRTILIGTDAGDALTTEQQNIMMGYQAGQNVTAASNVLIGTSVAPTLVSGANCTIVGNFADVVNATDGSLVAVGWSAKSEQSGTSVGVSALSGPSGVAVGNNCSTSVTGQYNVAVGQACAPTLVGGTGSIVIGYAADTDANLSQAVVIGRSAVLTADYGVVVGAFSDWAGTNSVILGASAGNPAATATGTVVVGYQAATTAVTGAYNTLLGSTTDVTAGTEAHSIALGSGATITASNQMMVGSSGSAIGTVHFGNGLTNAAPQNVTIQVTGGAGSGINGANLRLQSGLGTGTTGISGSLEFYTSDASGGASAAHAAQWVGSCIPDEGTITGLTTGQASRGFTFRRSVELQDLNGGSYNVAITDSGKTFHNTGAAGATTFNLPAASPGLWFTFIVGVGQNLIISPNGTDTIQVAGSTSTATTGDVRANTIGSVITIIATLDTSQTAPEWFAVSVVGTWTIN